MPFRGGWQACVYSPWLNQDGLVCMQLVEVREGESKQSIARMHLLTACWLPRAAGEPQPDRVRLRRRVGSQGACVGSP